MGKQQVEGQANRNDGHTLDANGLLPGGAPYQRPPTIPPIVWSQTMTDEARLDAWLQYLATKPSDNDAHKISTLATRNGQPINGQFSSRAEIDSATPPATTEIAFAPQAETSAATPVANESAGSQVAAPPALATLDGQYTEDADPAPEVRSDTLQYKQTRKPYQATVPLEGIQIPSFDEFGKLREPETIALLASIGVATSGLYLSRNAQWQLLQAQLMSISRISPQSPATPSHDRPTFVIPQPPQLPEVSNPTPKPAPEDNIPPVPPLTNFYPEAPYVTTQTIEIAGRKVELIADGRPTIVIVGMIPLTMDLLGKRLTKSFQDTPFNFISMSGDEGVNALTQHAIQAITQQGRLVVVLSDQAYGTTDWANLSACSEVLRKSKIGAQHDIFTIGVKSLLSNNDGQIRGFNPDIYVEDLLAKGSIAQLMGEIVRASCSSNVIANHSPVPPTIDNPLTIVPTTLDSAPAIVEDAKITQQNTNGQPKPTDLPLTLATHEPILAASADLSAQQITIPPLHPATDPEVDRFGQMTATTISGLTSITSANLTEDVDGRNVMLLGPASSAVQQSTTASAAQVPPAPDQALSQSSADQNGSLIGAEALKALVDDQVANGMTDTRADAVVARIRRMVRFE